MDQDLQYSESGEREDGEKGLTQPSSVPAARRSSNGLRSKSVIAREAACNVGARELNFPGWSYGKQTRCPALLLAREPEKRSRGDAPDALPCATQYSLLALIRLELSVCAEVETGSSDHQLSFCD